ncbi:MAG: 16S rRNA (guanine(966)-N(2))-methyltransferase RsmD [candidate division WOR-3 bacterium]
MKLWRVKMQITGGKFKGFKVKVSKDIRPTSAFNRKRIFDILRDVKGFKVLDLFCGSGALGLEALSRGASFCVFVDISNESVKVVKENLKKLGITDMGLVLREDALKFCRNWKNGEFDLIFADPPYSWDRYDELVSGVSNLLKDGGIFVLELSSRVKPPENETLKMFKFIKGGDSAFAFYSKA